MGPRWRYLLGELWGGLRGHLLMTVATVLTVTVCLTLGGVGLLTQRQVSLTSRLLYAQIQVSIFLQDGLADEQMVALRTQLEDDPLVSNVIYESQEDAYQTAQELFADNPSILQAIGPETLPASFRLELVDPGQTPAVESLYRNWPGVEQVSQQDEVVEELVGLLRTLQTAGYFIAALQVIGGIALIANTIRLSAFARREQIGIMKLVGATNWYIALPFILEGVVAGLLGSVGAFGLLWLANETLIDANRDKLAFTPLVDLGDILVVMPILVVLCLAVAATTSFVSLRRFLDV